MVRFEKMMRFIVCGFNCTLAVIGIVMLINPELNNIPTEPFVLSFACLSGSCFGYCLSAMIEIHIRNKAKTIKSKFDYYSVVSIAFALNSLLYYCFQKGLMYFFFPEFKGLLVFGIVPLYQVVFWVIALSFAELFRIKVYSLFIEEIWDQHKQLQT